MKQCFMKLDCCKKCSRHIRIEADKADDNRSGQATCGDRQAVNVAASQS